MFFTIAQKNQHLVNQESTKDNIDGPAILSGVLYGLSMFGFGFVMGIVRTFVIEPWMGDELMSVLMELPVMITICWQLSKQSLMGWHILNTWVFLDRTRVHNMDSIATTIGTTGFLTLLSLEVMLSIIIFQKSFEETREDLASVKGSVGLASQLIACSFPMIQEVALERNM
jgi:uncharacterized membrane protein YqjE